MYLVSIDLESGVEVWRKGFLEQFWSDDKTLTWQMKQGGSKPPPIYSKYANFNNFWWDCLMLTYWVCIDSEFGTTGYINVHVSYKTITGVMNGAFSQKVGGLLKYNCSNHAKILNMRINLKIRFYITICVWWKSIQKTKWSLELITPSRPRWEMYKL